MKKRNLLLCCLLAAGCSEIAPNNDAKAGEAANAPSTVKTPSPADAIPMYRDSVKAEPIAEHKERTTNPLNDWYFSVKVYETPKTFQYVMKVQYEEMEGDDTLKLPNLGTTPKVIIQKGADKYTCIVGFMDNHDQFREYKKVYVKNNQLKVTSLKHYTVATYEK